MPGSAASLHLLRVCGDEEALEEEELQVSRGEDEEAEAQGHPGHVLRVGEEKEIVHALLHAALGVVTKHVEDTRLHFVRGILRWKCKKNEAL